MPPLFYYKKNLKKEVLLGVGGESFTGEDLKIQIILYKGDFRKFNLINKRVAILCGNGPEALVTILTCASVSSCVPLSPEIKKEELEYFISELKIAAILTVEDFNFGQIIKKVPVFRISRDKSGFFNLKKINQISQKKKINKKNNIAIILHTSGTTAKPKIVPLSRSNIFWSAKNMISALKLSEKDVCLDVMPFFHVHGLMVAIATLLSGGTIICPPKFEARKFYQWLAKFSPTWYTASPTLHQAIVDLAGVNNKIIKKSKLRFIRSSSAGMPIKLLRDLEKIFRAPIAESYGMSEAALQITSNPLPPKKRKAGSVGVAHGLQIAVINQKGQLLKNGATGEIIIRGKNIIKRYENNEEVNQKSFLNGWLRTGDLGYFDKDRFLFIRGRTKEMINKGGEKISPLEIEEIIMKHPKIKTGVVFSVPHPSLGEDIGAAVVLEKRGAASEEEIKIFLKKNISSFKVPSRIFILDEIPKGPTGKIQRIGLYEKIKPIDEQERILPQSIMEKKIMKIWQQVLSHKKIAANDNFFEIGGDSLKVNELISLLGRAGFGQIKSSDFFENPTIRGIISLIKTKKTGL